MTASNCPCKVVSSIVERGPKVRPDLLLHQLNGLLVLKHEVVRRLRLTMLQVLIAEKQLEDHGQHYKANDPRHKPGHIRHRLREVVRYGRSPALAGAVGRGLESIGKSQEP
jgi:hypothetical protein